MSPASVESLEVRVMLSGTPIISEFLAGNSGGLRDADGESSDWIELYNPTDAPFDLNGWSLTDSAGDLNQWVFPAVSIEAHQFLTVFASGKDRTTGPELHTNFKIAVGGEYLALVSPSSQIVSQFAPSFPVQFDNISYGAVFDTANLVQPGANAQVLIPTDNSLGTTWTTEGFDSTGWTTGTTGVGFGIVHPGFNIEYVKSNRTVDDLSVANSVLADPSLQMFKVLDTAPVINYMGNGGGSNFGNELAFPTQTVGEDIDDFIVRATGTVSIPTAGQWTFGVNSDDGFGLQLERNGVVFSTEYSGTRGASDTLATFDIPEGGEWNLSLVLFERSGGASGEMFAAQGALSSFDPSAFHLIGDDASGGLAAHAAIGAGSTIGIGTDVAASMLNVNPSALIRIPFDATNPSAYDALLLKMRYDDGFVAYLNGVEVARRNAPAGVINFNSTATADRTILEATTPETINLTPFINLLHDGTNVLSIQGLNSAVDDDSFLVFPELTATTVHPELQRFFETPTPGDPNEDPALGVIERVTADIPAGFYTAPITVTLSTPSAGAYIRYTTDSSTPTATHGILYTGPVTISATTTLRAGAFRDDYIVRPTITRTYIYLDDVIHQSPSDDVPGGIYPDVGAPPDGWPSSWGNNVVDYGMDQTIVDQEGEAAMKAALASLPSLSITTDLTNLFDPASGIYSNAGNDGRDWERPASVELLNTDGSAGFQVNAGLRVRGGYSRSGGNPKHAFRLFFRDEYGDSSLDYPVFGSDGPKSFEKLDVRTAQNYSWSFGGDPSNTMIQDGFARQSQGDMGELYSHSLWVNLYLDGQYWGIYQIEERPEADFASTYLGGDSDNYDVIKPEAGPYTIYATDGNLDAYQNLWQYVTTENLVDNSAYYFIQGKDANGVDDPSIPNEDVLLDVDNLITYMIGILHGGNLDAPISAFLGNQGVNNFFAIRDRTGRLGFQYIQHDAEHTLHNVNEDRNGPYPAGADFAHFNPQYLHQQLMQNAEYRLAFADAVQKDFFNDGPMSVPRSEQRFQNDVDQLNLAIIAESARWGDAQRQTSPLGRNDWLNAVAAMEGFLANRNPILLQQFSNVGLFPTIGAPQFLINGAEQNSGQVAIGSLLRFAASRGLVYYTTDGSDPRLIGGGINPNALIYDPSATATTLLASGASWKYNDEGLNLGTGWTDSAFDDSSWSAGNAELGYGDGDEITTVAAGPSASHFITTYFRTTFNVADTSDINGLLLRLKRDDGAVVYINGVEATRSNMPNGAVDWTTLASSGIGGTDEQTFNEIQINPGLLVNGTNTIAVEIHQSNPTSSDLSFDAELLASVQSNPGLVINSSTHILARAFDGTDWSPQSEGTLSTAVPAVAGNLAVTEIQYNPVAMAGATSPPENDKENFEFIELQNIGTETITLAGVRFITGIAFDFSSGDVAFLAPGEHVVVVKNLQAFTTRYGSTAKIAGVYTGNLSNGGEQLVLVDASNATIQDFTYDDDPTTTPPWPQAADGGGSSLTVISTSGNYSLPSNWRASTVPNGTPGFEENGAPTAISLSSNTVDENLPNAVVGTLAATDPNLGEALTFTLTDSAGGTFAINGSSLIVANGVLLDFETRKTYPISIRVTDAGGLTFDQSFTINVTNVNEAPTVIALSNAQIDEGQAVDTVIGTFTTTDPDAPQTAQTFTYSLLAGDTSAFTIDSTGQLKTAAEFNFEAKSSYSITVRSTDQDNLTVDKVFTITVNNINEAPTAVTLSNSSVNENQPAGTTVGSLATSDQDAPLVAQTFTYSLVGGDTTAFTIDAAGNVKTTATFDFETKSSYSIVVRSTDQGNLPVESTLTITVNNVNEAPTAITLSNASVDENQLVGTVVGRFSTTDPDAPLTSQSFSYTLVGGDVSAFTIDSAGNLKTNAVFDFEVQSTYTIIVRSQDQGNLTVDATFTISVNDLAEAPTAITLSGSNIDEQQAIGTTIGQFATTDPDAARTTQTFSYSIVAGDSSAFVIDGTGQLKSSIVFDFEVKSSYTITVRSTDQDGLSVDATFTITVNNVNEAPTSITLSNTSLDENLPVGTTIGSLATVDPDAPQTPQTLTYSLVGGDVAAFKIDDSGNLQSNATFDFETKSTYSVTVRSTDQGNLLVDTTFDIVVNNVNESPTAITLSNASIGENLVAGTLIGAFATTDPDAPLTAQTFTYSLVSGDTTAFTINGAGNLLSAATFDFETQPSYTITVRSTDQDGQAVEATFTITVTDANEDPTAISLSNSSIDENLAVGTIVGTFATADPDESHTPQSFTYALVSGDVAAFTIDGSGNLKSSAMFDFETKSTYSITVRSTDQNNLSVDTPFTISVTNVNETPTALTLSNSSLNEGLVAGTVIGSFATTDPDAPKTVQAFTYNLVAGDMSAFTIDNTGKLKSNAIFDFNTKNSYSITVRSTDQDGLFIEKVFTITVNNVNEVPTDIVLSNATIDENQDSGTTVGTFSTIDPDDPEAPQSFVYTLVAADIGAFAVDAAGNLTTNVAFDFETQSTFSITVRSTDQGGLSVDRQFTISVANLNEAPTDISLSGLSVAENDPSATVVGTFSSADPDANSTFTYALVPGADDTDNASFDIVNGQLVTQTSFDFETKTSYSIRVSTTDQEGLSIEKAFTINVTGRNEPPTALNLSAQSVSGNQPIGTVVGSFSTIDPDSSNTFTYAFASGSGDDDNGSFTIANGVLKTAEVFHMHIKSSYSILIRTTDQGGLSFDRQFTITVTPANEQPTDITLSSSTIAENLIAGSLVGSFSSSDPNPADTFSYSLVAGVGGTDNSSFTILNGQLRTARSFDFETKQTYSILVRTTDQGTLTFDKQFTITVTDADDAPTDIALSGASINEDQAVGTVIGAFSSTDQDVGDTFTYSLVSGEGSEDNSSFTIENGQLQSAIHFDFETKKNYTVRVRSTDQDGLTFDKQFVISVTDGNDAPTNASLSSTSIAENKAVGSLVGTFSSSDPNAGNTFTYSLIASEGSTNNASFTILNNQLRTTEIFDYEAKSSYSILVRTTDQGGLTFDKQFTISVTDANDGPTDLALNGASIGENQDAGTLIGAFSTTDPDVVDTFNYTLVAGEGSADNSSFLITNGQLKSSVAFDFEARNRYSIRVRATDKGGLTIERQFTINVTDANDAPIDIALSDTSVAENQPGGTVIGTFSATDPDTGNTITYSLVNGVGSTDNARFTIVNGQLKTNGSFDFEATNSYSILVRATDQGGKTFEKPFTISVTDGNDTPTNISLSSTAVAENQIAGTTVGVLTSTDQDLGDTFTYALVAGVGSTDNVSFAIVNGELRTASTIDFEAKSSYSIRISTTDQDGLSFDKFFIVNVIDKNEAPAIDPGQSFLLSENSSANVIVGTVTASDPDLSGPFNFRNFSITGGNVGNTFAINPSTGQLMVNNPSLLDLETTPVFSLQISLSDGAGAAAVPTVVTIQLTDVNEVPTISGVQDQTILEDGATDVLLFNVGDVETSASQLVVSATSSNQALIPDANIHLFGADAGRSLVATPLANQFGRTTITLTVSDGVNTSTRSFVVTVTAVADAPTLTEFQTQTILEDNSTDSLAFTVGDVDSPVGSLIVTATSSNTAVVANSGLAISGSGASRNLIVTPVANRNGTAVITVTVSDGVLTSSRQFEVTVTAVEDPTVIKLNPKAMTLVGSTKKGVAVDGAATIGDVDTPNLNFNGAILEVTGQSAKDRLLILNRGSIGRRGKNIWYNGDVLGTVEGGKKGEALTVRLTAAATLNGVQELLRSIGFKPAKHAGGTRSIHVKLSNIDGTDTAEATRQIIVPGAQLV